MIISRDIVIAEALKWTGAQWHHRALVPYQFCDCVRFLEGVAKAVGLLPQEWEPPMYARQWHLHQRLELLHAVMLDLGAHPIALTARQPGDCLGFLYGHVTSHLALCMPDDTIIHADSRKGRVVHHHLSGPLLSRLRVAWTLPGVAP